MIIKPRFIHSNGSIMIKITNVLDSSNLRRLRDALIGRPFYFYPNADCEDIFVDEKKEYLVRGIIAEPVVRRLLFTPLFLKSKGASEFRNNRDIWIANIVVRFTKNSMIFQEWYEEYLKESLPAYKLANSWEVSDEGER